MKHLYRLFTVCEAISQFGHEPPFPAVKGTGRAIAPKLMSSQ